MTFSEPTRNVLVTGAAGYIGARLVTRLCHEGCKVYGIDAIESGVSHENFHFTQADLLNHEVHQKVFEDLMKDAGFKDKGDVLFHLAGISDAGICEKNPKRCHEVNRLLAKEVFNSASRAGIKQHIFPSSAQAYGASNSPALSEAMLLKPITVYGQTKALAEEELRQCFKENSITADVVRLSNIYGGSFKEGTVMKNIHDQIQAKKNPIEVLDRRPVRDFIFIDDVIEGLVRIMLSQLDGKFDVINLGTGKGTSIDGLITELTSVCGKTTNERAPGIEALDSPDDRIVLDIRRLVARTHWRPGIDLRTGLQKMMRGSENGG